MAKRIKIKGKPPRGLSKAERIVRGADATFKGESRLVNKRRERENYKGELVGMPDRIADSHIETLAGLRDYAHLSPEARRGKTKPSSTRKKRVKEGSRKFVGPRTFRSELRQDADTRWRGSDYGLRPATSMSEEELRLEDASFDVARRNLGKKLPRGLGERGYKKVRARDQDFGASAANEPEFGRGGISKNQRLKALLSKLMERFYEDPYYES